MSEWVSRAAQASGMEEARVWAAMTAALGLLQQHADPRALEPLYDQVEGAERLALSEEARPRAGGGLFGGMLKSAGGLSGGAVADAMGVLERLRKQGLDKADLKRLLPAARDTLRQATGRDLLGEAIRSAHGVGGLLGAD